MVLKNFILGLSFSIVFSSSIFADHADCSDPATQDMVASAKQVLEDRIYLTLATSNLLAAPWNSPLYTAYDADYNFFWISSKRSRHSRNIRMNGRSSVVIYDSTAPLFTGFGVYMQGFSVELYSTDKIAHGLDVISDRAGLPLPPPDFYQGDFKSRVYKFIPSRFWVNTVVEVDGEYIDKRVEITECIVPAAKSVG